MGSSRLSPEEAALIRDVGFDDESCQILKEYAGSALERLSLQRGGRLEDGPGICVAVNDGEEAERLMNVLREPLRSRGYRAFWSHRHGANGLMEGEELVVLRTTDPYALIRLLGTDGANYGISTGDIVARFDAWRELCEFDVVGASTSWVALQFSTLPKKLCEFAEEVYLFCPDTVEQGTGLWPERQGPERLRAATQLCPKISSRVAQRSLDMLSQIESTAPEMAELAREMARLQNDEFSPTEMGVRLLALDLRDKKFLFLWWD